MGKITGINKTWYLEGTLQDGRPWVIPINKSPFIIGRRDDCSLSILSKNISRRHAEIFMTSTYLMIQDLRSTNGTFVNESRIKTAIKLNDGDTIHFADMKFRILLKDSNDLLIQSGTFFLDRPKKSDDFITHFDITKREEEILYYLLEGKSTKKIADTLFISEGTAKNHVLNIFKKVNVHSRFELLAVYNNFKIKK
ncbi:MAG: FHA domain-containing protein [Spirochaetes bacterium]|nr:FHA domain-containing protein [Spirochaetota bacterium]